MVSWIPHCVDQINRTDLEIGQGGIDNFVEAGKKLRGEPHGLHKGYVFSNAWVHQTVEAMSIALMIDPQGDARDHPCPSQNARYAGRLDSENPCGARTGWVPANCIYAFARRRQARCNRHE